MTLPLPSKRIANPASLLVSFFQNCNLICKDSDHTGIGNPPKPEDKPFLIGRESIVCGGIPWHTLDTNDDNHGPILVQNGIVVSPIDYSEIGGNIAGTLFVTVSGVRDVEGYLSKDWVKFLSGRVIEVVNGDNKSQLIFDEHMWQVYNTRVIAGPTYSGSAGNVEQANMFVEISVGKYPVREGD